MKRLFSKKSGFTLVEIIIAFAVFAIMATMIIQVLNLTINRKNENTNFEGYLQNQEKTLVAKGQKYQSDAYDSSKAPDGTIDLAFTDKDGNALDTGATSFNYQSKTVDNTAGTEGLNYFIAEHVDYAEGGEGTIFVGGEEGGAGGEAADPGAAGGSSQMSRYDTRLTGTKGINSIKIEATPNATKDEYTVKVTVYDSGVDSIIKSHSQVSLFFDEAKYNKDGAKPNILSVIVNGKDKDLGELKYVKKTGLNGVNVHCRNSNGFNGNSETFTVKFDKPIENLAFGDNVEGGNTYSSYAGNANIFGAYDKPAAPAS